VLLALLLLPLQMISLMDNLLKRENLDLRLTPYTVLPTGEAAADAAGLLEPCAMFGDWTCASPYTVLPTGGAAAHSNAAGCHRRSTGKHAHRLPVHILQLHFQTCAHAFHPVVAVLPLPQALMMAWCSLCPVRRSAASWQSTAPFTSTWHRRRLTPRVRVHTIIAVPAAAAAAAVAAAAATYCLVACCYFTNLRPALVMIRMLCFGLQSTSCYLLGHE
jgi:hypothetical protein